MHQCYSVLYYSLAKRNLLQDLQYSMPRGRKKVATKTTKRTTRKARKVIVRPQRKSFSNPFKWTESYTSLLMGIVVVIVAVLFVVSLVRQTHHIQDTSSISTAAIPTISEGTTANNQPHQQTYVVKAGDDLWNIAEKFYKSGDNWVDIAKANNLSDPSMIFSGNVLIIPKVTPAVATATTEETQITPTPAPTKTSITGAIYTVQHGDDLWDIAVRAYGDGYQWTKIADANDLANPGLIHADNVLKIPRN